ncbi:MAG: hypothetical protein KAT68_01050 [Bacteroidales bacterium]|nr:hypothetical protein [Bacteroidales bacterium]
MKKENFVKLKKTIVILFFMLFGIIFNSCEKDELNKSSELKSDIYVNNNVLCIKNNEVFNNNYDLVKEKYEGIIINEYNNTKSLNDTTEIIDPDVENDEPYYSPEDQYLDELENNLGITSLRTRFNKEEAMLLNSVIDFEAKDLPDEGYISDDVFNTYINEKGEIKIGDTIYIYEKYKEIVITNGSFELLEEYRNDKNSVINNSNIEIYYYNDDSKPYLPMIRWISPWCGYETIIDGYRKRLYGKQWLKNGQWQVFWRGRAGAKSKCYYKDGNKWKKSRERVWASINGTIYGIDDYYTNPVYISYPLGSQYFNMKNARHKVTSRVYRLPRMFGIMEGQKKFKSYHRMRNIPMWIEK